MSVTTIPYSASAGARPTSAMLLGYPLAAVGIVVAGYVATQPVPREGLEFLWILPLAFALSVLMFPAIIGYRKGGVAFKVFYAIILMRYLVSPVLVVMTQGRAHALWVDASAGGYRFSTAVAAAELVIVSLAISRLWPKAMERVAAGRSRSAEVPRFSPKAGGITLGGVVALTILLVVILSRGMDDIRSSFGFLVITEKYEADSIDSYAVTALQVMKSFLFIGVAVWCSRRYRLRGNVVWLAFAGVAAFLNIATYFGYNRSLILQTAIATIVTLLHLFPKQRALIVLALVPVAGVVLYSLAILKQFNVSVDSGGLDQVLTLDLASQTIEAYVNGSWPLATAYDAATAMHDQVSLLTIVRSYTDNFFPFKVPGFLWPNELFAGTPSVLDLYQAHTAPAQGAMLPLAGEMWFYGGVILGPLLVVMANVFVVYLLVEVDVRSRCATGAQNAFIYGWLASLLGLAMCYCMITLVWSFSKFALFLGLLFWINNRIVVRHRW